MLSQVARAAGIHVSQLFRWRKELCRIEEPGTETAGALVPVIVAKAAPAALSTPSGSLAPSPLRRKRNDVTIELGRCRRIRVDSNIDTDALGRILDCVLERR